MSAFKCVKCVEKSTFILSFVRFLSVWKRAAHCCCTRIPLLSWHKSETNSHTHSYTFTHLRAHTHPPTVILSFFLSPSLTHNPQSTSTLYAQIEMSRSNPYIALPVLSFFLLNPCFKFNETVVEMVFVSFVVEKSDENVFSSVSSSYDAGS